MQSRPKPTLMGGAAGSAEGASSNVPALSEKEMSALKDGIAGLAKTAVQLSELSKVATATAQLSDKLDAASQAAAQFVEAGKSVAEKSASLGNTYAQVTEDMQKVVAGTKAYETQVVAVSSQLASLNAVYEMQLKALQAQVDAYKAQTEKITDASVQVDKLSAGVKVMAEHANEALKNQEAYVAGAKQLASQVADLNKVYGNMLNALA
jgi:chromosome segregation ATPase